MFEITRESARNAYNFSANQIQKALREGVQGRKKYKTADGNPYDGTNAHPEVLRVQGVNSYERSGYKPTPGPTQQAIQQNATPTMNGSRNNPGVVAQASRNIAPEGRPGHLTETMMVQQNQPFTARGKKWGWAQKNGQWVPVEWGSVAGIKLDNVDHPVYFNSVQQG